MIQFNKLQINREGTKLTIDIAVKDLEYYNNVYIVVPGNWLLP